MEFCQGCLKNSVMHLGFSMDFAERKNYLYLLGGRVGIIILSIECVPYIVNRECQGCSMCVWCTITIVTNVGRFYNVTQIYSKYTFGVPVPTSCTPQILDIKSPIYVDYFE